MSDTLDCFLLTRQWRDLGDGLELRYWAVSERGPVRIVVDGERAVCFIERRASYPDDHAEGGRVSRRALDLATLAEEPVDGLYFRHQRDLVGARELLRGRGVRLFESDIKPSDRYLMERFVGASFRASGTLMKRDGYLELRNPSLKGEPYRAPLGQLSLDVESDGLSGSLYSIAVDTGQDTRVFIVSETAMDGHGLPIEVVADEKALLERFFAWLARADPDLILGWNVINFDLDLMERRCEALGVAFAMGRGGDRATILQPQGRGGTRVARIPGRVVLDGIDWLRAAFWSFESYELETVAQALLGRGKHDIGGHDKVAEIRRLYHEDPARLAAYNLEDCRLVTDIFAETGLVEFAARRAELTGLAMDRVGGSVAAFDNLYLPRLHRHGCVAPDVGDAASGPESPGGYVLDSEPGIYDNILVLDFKSLYPSIIRTFMIDPLGLASPGEDPVPGFLGASFARRDAILPMLIEELWRARDDAKRRGDGALSQAVKIIMNSFYGVLGTSGCRFSDARLTSSITRRGHEIIQRSRDHIESCGHRVIYGDTDSLFVRLKGEVDEAEARRTGAELARALNDWWRARLAEEFRLESYLEIQFETLYLRFLMPTVRGELTGSKKRYAGLVDAGEGNYEVVFKGLESVRTDWTPLARRFQRELYRRIFLGEAYEDFVQGTLADLLAGKLDEELVYRKRLRRNVDEYTRNVPPIPKPDYQHYRERQLAPAADGILHFLGTSFQAITDAQLAIF
jgi:DNA polymerase-2